jgi:raffinose/stachyose/melibiose transport system permease protein/N-acetylglucosamine transport system permease protein
MEERLTLNNAETAAVGKGRGFGLANKIVSVFFKWLFWCFLALQCISLLLIVYWMLVTAFKSGSVEYEMDRFGLPNALNLENFKFVYKKLAVEVVKNNGTRIRYGVLDMFGTSVFYSGLTSLIVVFFTSLMAYVIARYKFFGRNFLFMFGIFLMITPIIGSLPSAMVLKKALGVYDNLFLTFVTTPVGCFSGMNFLILYAAFKGVSWSYAEAAFVDGGGHYCVLFKIMLPMALPTIGVIFVLSFLAYWNDYQTFLIWLPSTPNLALGVYNFQNNMTAFGATMPEVITGFLIAAVPAMILFFVSQRLIMSKFTVGGLKG